MYICRSCCSWLHSELTRFVFISKFQRGLCKNDGAEVLSDIYKITEEQFQYQEVEILLYI